MKDRLGITAAQGVGYKELLPVVRGAGSLDDAREAVIRATMALAKRQRTFFGRDSRIRWIPWHDGFDAAAEYALTVAAKMIKETAWTL
jgi:tRNA dimethylallyltransferase